MAETTPVANQIAPPDPTKGLNTFSGILGIQQQQLALQQGQAALPGIQARSEQDVQRNRELQAAQALAFNGAKGGQYTNDDGTLNRQKMADDITSVAPVYGQEVSGRLLSQANEIVANQQAHQALTVARKKEMGDTFAALAADPELDNTKFIDAIETLRQQHKNDPEFSRMLTSMSTHMPGNADTATLRNLAGRWSAAATGEPQAAPSTIDTGGQVQPGATSRFTGAFTPAGGAINKTLAPTIVTNPNTGGQGVAGGGQGTTPAPIGGGAFGTGPQNTWQPVQNQPEILKSIEDTRKADADYGVNRHINQQILRLSQSTDTGPGTEVWHHALGAVAGPLGGNNVADYQTIGAYLDRQAALSARQMGLPDTNAGLATAASLSGTTGYQPGALQTKVKLTDALVEGAHQYRSGLDRVVGTGPNQDLRSFNQYRNAWAQNFDPMVYLYKNADKAERAEIVGKLSPQQASELLRKARNLDQLAQGKMPGG